MNESLSYTEQPDGFRKKIERKPSVVSYEKRNEKKQEIAELELKSQLLETCDEISSDSGKAFSRDQIYEAIRGISVFSQNPSSLSGISLNDILEIVRAYFSRVESEKRNDNGDRLVNQAATLELRVEMLQSEGKSNTEIIEQVLAENDTRQLTLPSEKLNLYRNFLELSTSQEYGSDAQGIKSIIDETPIDFDDPASFEMVIQKIYSDDRISENTKYMIEKQFGFLPIRNGSELRKAVTFRDKFRTDYLKAIGEIDIDLGRLNESIIELEKALAELQEAIELSDTFDEQFDLEDKRDKLKENYDDLIDQRLQLELSKGEIEEKIPSQETVLLSGRITVKEGVFSLKMPDGEKFILPEGLGNDELADMANSYFIWQSMDSLGLAHTLFPEEDLNDKRLPSGSFMTFANSLLSRFHMSHSGSILKLDELGHIRDILSVLRSKKTVENKELSKEEGAKIDLKTVGIIENNQINYLRLNEVLEQVSLSQNPDHDLIYSEMKPLEEAE